jgi:hypothetical protein
LYYKSNYTATSEFKKPNAAAAVFGTPISLLVEIVVVAEDAQFELAELELKEVVSSIAELDHVEVEEVPLIGGIAMLRCVDVETQSTDLLMLEGFALREAVVCRTAVKAGS